LGSRIQALLERRNGNLRHLAQQVNRFSSQTKDHAMKKIAFTVAAVSALALAACNSGTETNGAANEAGVTNEAVSDVNSAETAAQGALGDVVNTGSDLVNGAGNVASEAGEAVSNVASDAGNAVSTETNAH
jgi:predicted small secreted protein